MHRREHTADGHASGWDALAETQYSQAGPGTHPKMEASNFPSLICPFQLYNPALQSLTIRNHRTLL